MKLLKNHYTKKDGSITDKGRYACGVFARSGSWSCSSHGIREKHLIQIAKMDILNHAEKTEINEQTVLEQIRRKRNTFENAEHKTLTSRSKAIKSRLGELEKLTSNLYEEMVRGDISRETLLQLLAKYQIERESLESEFEEVKEKISTTNQVTEDAQKWIALIKKYRNIDTLERELLMQLIDNITIGKKEIVDSKTTQEVKIAYNFAGVVD